MTREEAIQILSTRDAHGVMCGYTSGVTEALDMAIEALQDRPSGEWTYLHGLIGSYMTISCPFCGTTFNDVAEWNYNYCPSCGAIMKGGDTE
jgi:PHP family Zn ribbon phosphoesterase